MDGDPGLCAMGAAQKQECRDPPFHFTAARLEAGQVILTGHAMPSTASAQYPATVSCAAATPRVAEQPIWPIVFVIYMTLLPREVHIAIADNMIFGDRLALMMCVPWIVYSLWRGAIKFVLPDWLVMFAGLWSVLAMSHAYDLTRGLISGGSYAFDAIAGYYLARISFRSLSSMRRALIACAPGFFLAGCTVMIESVTHHLFVRPAFAAIFGQVQYHGGTRELSDVLNNHDVRLGLLRGLGPWPHPILAGLHLATLLPIYWMCGIRGWPRMIGIAAAFLAFFTISSAAVASLAIGIALISYDYFTRIVKELSWRQVLYTVIVLLVIVQSTSNSGIVGLIIRFGTFDPQTGYYRQLIWQYGSQSVLNHPWLGIGFDPYERPEWMYTDSVDNHWLLWGIRYGLPAVLSLLGASIATVWALSRSIGRTPSRVDARFYRGILMSLTILLIMMFTVTLQGGTLTWFTLLLGGCVGCAQRGFGRTRPVAWADGCGRDGGRVRATSV